MVIASIFELDSIKDQLSLIRAISSHIDFDNITEKELDPDYGKMLEKMNNTSKNLTEKYEHLKKLLEN